MVKRAVTFVSNEQLTYEDIEDTTQWTIDGFESRRKFKYYCPDLDEFYHEEDTAHYYSNIWDITYISAAEFKLDKLIDPDKYIPF